MIKQLFLFLSLIISSLSIQSQNTYEFVTSDVHFNKGYDHLLKEEYSAAIHYFKKIHRSDTNFHIAQYNTLICFYNDKKFNKANSVAIAALKDQNSLSTDVYYWYIESLIAQRNFNKAKEIIVEAQKKYSLFYKYQYQMGKIALEEGKIKAAKNHFKLLLKIHPEHAESHYQLAHLNAQQGKITEAILGYQFSILANRTSTLLQPTFIEMEDVMQNNFATLSSSSASSEFKNLDQIITSQLALKDNYKADIDLNYTVIRQTDILLKQFQFNPKSSNYSMKLYGDFIQQVKVQKLEKAYVLYLISILNVNDINKEINKNEMDLKRFHKLLKKYLHIYLNRSKYPVNGTIYDGEYNNNDYGLLEGIGSKSNDLPIGDWIYFYPTGSVQSEISFNDNGEKNGLAKWYDEKGNLIQYVNYKNDATIGEAYFSHQNYSKWYSGNLNNDKLNGAVEMFDKKGFIKSATYFKNNIPQGEWKEYAMTGKVNLEGNYNKDGIVHGPYSTYYDNGNLYLKTTFKNGEMDGQATSHHINGQIKYEGKYTNGKKTGVWKEYNNQGQLILVQNYVNDQLEGEEYDIDYQGDTIVFSTYKKGEMHGTQFTYHNQRVLWKHHYKKGKLKSFENIDSTGNITHSGNSEYQINDAFGYKYKTGIIENGRFPETLTSYWKNGKIKTIEHIQNQKLNGEYTEYDFEGTVLFKCNYLNDEYHGKYESFYPSGKTSSVGHYQNNEKIGAWKYYSLNGKINMEEYYSNGNPDGYSTYYSIDGVKKFETFYRDGIAKRVDVFNEKGRLNQRLELQHGSGEFEMKNSKGVVVKKGTFKGGEWDGKLLNYFPNGKVSSEENYVNGYLHGIQKNYYLNGNLKEDITYEYNLRDGKSTAYYESGKKRFEITYSNNDLIGFVRYYESGKTQTVRTFKKNGDKSKVLEYHFNGQIESTTNYHYGFIQGKRNTFDHEGNLAISRLYNGEILYAYSYLKNGKLIENIPFNGTGTIQAHYNNGQVSCVYELKDYYYEGKYLRYFNTGKPWVEANYKLDELDGKYIVYDPNGNLNVQENYSQGALNGPSYRYHKNGKVKSEENFTFGVQHGVSKYFDEEGQLIQTVTYNDDSIIDIK